MPQETTGQNGHNRTILIVEHVLQTQGVAGVVSQIDDPLIGLVSLVIGWFADKEEELCQ